MTHVRGGHILIGESDRDCRSAFMWCLLSEGYWVEPVANAFDVAVALDRQEIPDLVILDLALSGLPVRALIDRMRESERLRGIPILATATAAPFFPLPASVEFLKKPCAPAELIARVRALGGHRLKSLFRNLARDGAGLSKAV